MADEGRLNALIHESIWISIGSIAMLVGGFLFWLIAGLLSSPTAIGYATTAFSIASLTSGLLNLGLDRAALRDVAAWGRGVFCLAYNSRNPNALGEEHLRVSFELHQSEIKNIWLKI